METYNFIWNIGIKSNLGNNKIISIKEKCKNVYEARNSIISNYLYYSRKGIPCYYLIDEYKLILSYLNDVNIQNYKEYYEITLDFLTEISTKEPIREPIQNIENMVSQNSSGLNVDAKPFYPQFSSTSPSPTTPTTPSSFWKSKYNGRRSLY